MNNASQSSGFVVKLDPDFKGVVFSTVLGGTAPSGSSVINAVAIDNSGNIYVTGYTSSADFPVTPGAFRTSPPETNPFGGALYAFLTEIAAAGDRLIFSTYFGGGGVSCVGGSSCLGAFGVTYGRSLAVDPNSNVILAGTTRSNNLPMTPGAYASSCRCIDSTNSAFVAKFAPGGSRLVWATYLPLTQQAIDYQEVSVSSVALDSRGNVVVAGTTPPHFPTTSGALQIQYPGTGYLGYVAKLDSSGQRLLFGTYFGGGVVSPPGSLNGVGALALDSQDEIWITGGSVPALLPFPVETPLFGDTYIAALSADVSTLDADFTFPHRGAGSSIVLTSQGVIAALGAQGLLIGNSSPGPSLAGIVGSAGYETSTALTPYELITLYGYNLGPQPPAVGGSAGGSLASSLGGTQVLFDGVAAPLLYAGPNQINAIVPGSVAGKASTQLQVITATGTVDGPAFPVVPSQPQIFLTMPDDGTGTVKVEAFALNQDGTANSAQNPAAVGSVVTIWPTGGGALAGNRVDGAIAVPPLFPPALPVSMLAGFANTPQEFQPATTLYAGEAPGMVNGILQINFQIPVRCSVLQTRHSRSRSAQQPVTFSVCIFINKRRGFICVLIGAEI